MLMMASRCADDQVGGACKLFEKVAYKFLIGGSLDSTALL